MTVSGPGWRGRGDSEWAGLEGGGVTVGRGEGGRVRGDSGDGTSDVDTLGQAQVSSLERCPATWTYTRFPHTLVYFPLLFPPLPSPPFTR